MQSVECNQLSNVITYNAMFQIVRLLAITNVKTIIKLQKPQRDVPKIYVAYYTNIAKGTTDPGVDCFDQ